LAKVGALVDRQQNPLLVREVEAQIGPTLRRFGY
jgi:hypothetical protein